MSDDETERQQMQKIGFTEEQIEKILARPPIEDDRLADFMAADMTKHVPHSIDAEGVQHFDVEALKQRLRDWADAADAWEEDDEADEGEGDADC